jgi:hypothetical protein
MFIDKDDDDDNDYESFNKILSILEDDHFPYKIKDGLPINKKGAKRDREKKVDPSASNYRGCRVEGVEGVEGEGGYRRPSLLPRAIRL